MLDNWYFLTGKEENKQKEGKFERVRRSEDATQSLRVRQNGRMPNEIAASGNWSADKVKFACTGSN
jgi:hypothetical protein